MCYLPMSALTNCNDWPKPIQVSSLNSGETKAEIKVVGPTPSQNFGGRTSLGLFLASGGYWHSSVADCIPSISASVATCLLSMQLYQRYKISVLFC